MYTKCYFAWKAVQTETVLTSLNLLCCQLLHITMFWLQQLSKRLHIHILWHNIFLFKLCDLLFPLLRPNIRSIQNVWRNMRSTFQVLSGNCTYCETSYTIIFTVAIMLWVNGIFTDTTSFWKYWKNVMSSYTFQVTRKLNPPLPSVGLLYICTNWINQHVLDSSSRFLTSVETNWIHKLHCWVSMFLYASQILAYQCLDIA